MGIGDSKLEKELGDSIPETARLYGFDNLGNTCYLNAILQALSFTVPFRENLLKYYAALKQEQKLQGGAANDDDLAYALAELYTAVQSQRKRVGSFTPRAFVKLLRKSNELFGSFAQQDGHEFYNYLINTVLERIQQRDFRRAPGSAQSAAQMRTWVQDLFQGVMTNETRCLCCERVSVREETFLDLSVDVYEDCSLTHCLAQFSSTETLASTDKFYCDRCCSLQEAEKRLRIKQAPPILALQLKRFKFDESLQMFRKLPYRVAFPTELRLVNTVQEDEDFFDLYAVVVHVGSSPSHGHYYSVVRSFDQWFIFDDNRITPLDVRELQSFFGGSAYQQSHTADTAYLLFYESRRASQLRRGNSPAPPRHTPHAPAQHTNPFSPPETPAGPQSQTPVPE